jgi:hypothetical protein
MLPSIGRQAHMRLRLLTALAIAGLVIVSCSSADQNTTAETPPGDAVDVAADFIKARDAWDSAKATTLLAPDAVLDDWVDTVEDYPDTMAYFRATDSRFTLGECRQTNTGQPAEVSCTYTYENAWTNALGVGPYSGSSFEFVIADGLIQDLANNFDSSGFSDDVWDVFNSWIRLNHNPDLLVMYPDGCCTPSHTPEAVVLWERYTNEFVGEQGA